MDLYFISGLGADKRVFQKLILPDLFTIHHIVWAPVSEEDSMEMYCKELSRQVNQSRPFILVGLSFGGIVAIQMSKILRPVQTVIISSYCFRNEIPKFYVFLAKTRFYRIIPSRFLLRPNKFVFRLFGANEPMKKKMLTNILEDTDPIFFRWAVKQLFTINNDWQPESFLHIHGTADKILPIHPNMKAIEVQGGEHLMVYSKAEEVSEILGRYLKRS
jgi:hypothetical protein